MDLWSRGVVYLYNCGVVYCDVVDLWSCGVVEL